eukprot:4259659-Pyramimonas_sp.AAC.1
MHAQVKPFVPSPVVEKVGITLDDIMDGNQEKLESSCQALFGLDEYHELSAQEKEEDEKRTKA